MYATERQKRKGDGQLDSSLGHIRFNKELIVCTHLVNVLREKVANHLQVTMTASLMQQSVALGVSVMGIRPASNEVADNIHATLATGVIKWGEANFVL